MDQMETSRNTETQSRPRNTRKRYHSQSKSKTNPRRSTPHGDNDGNQNTDGRPESWQRRPESWQRDHDQRLDEQDEENRPITSRTFTSPSVISLGDKGIFVTCDKGREKKSLVELADIVEEYLETHNLLHPQSTQPPHTSTTNDGSNPENSDSDIDIESAIKSELTNLTSTTKKPSKIRPFHLVPLDIPCVSFLRFHPSWPTITQINPIHIIHSVCDEIMKTNVRRSRYIKRLSPIIWLGKTLSSGLEKACQISLPRHFAHSAGTSDVKLGTTFAIRSTIRNNDKVTRDDAIRYIADQVSVLGHGVHRVDLKNYKKGVLLEVYRGWVAVAVVENEGGGGGGGGAEGESEFMFGFEQLKRFNVAEIQAEGLKRAGIGGRIGGSGQMVEIRDVEMEMEMEMD